MFNLILKHIVPIPKISDFNNYLFIGPHPDDIETGCAPTIAKLTKMGKKVSFLIATDGRMGSIDPMLFGDELVKVRKEESITSAKLLNVHDVIFLPFHDGGLYPIEELAQAIAKEIVKIKPDIVFVPDPDVINECHADHIKTGMAVKYAANMCPHLAIMRSMGINEACPLKALAFYYTDKPNSYISVNDTFEMREQALLCHKTQFDKEFINNIVQYNKLRSFRFGLRRFQSKCEGYRVLSDVHTHCFPEASDWKR